MLDSVKEAFQGTRGKVLIVGGLALTGYLLYTRWHTPAQTPAGDTASDPYSSTAPGTPGGSPPVTSPAGGDAAPTPTRPGDNSDWLSQGTEILRLAGMGSADAYTALQLALAGEPLNVNQYNAVSFVLARLGSPPEGMPPLSHASPSTTTTPAIPGLPPPVRLPFPGKQSKP
jgi:hypothetical protein